MMVAVEKLVGIRVIHGPSDKYVEPVTKVETSIVHSMADAKDHSKGFVNPRRAEVSIV
jgi:hypothetical protein